MYLALTMKVNQQKIFFISMPIIIYLLGSHLCHYNDVAGGARLRKKRNSTSDTNKNSSESDASQQKQKSQSNGTIKTQKRLNFEIKPSDSIQTDFRYVLIVVKCYRNTFLV